MSVLLPPPRLVRLTTAFTLTALWLLGITGRVCVAAQIGPTFIVTSTADPSDGTCAAAGTGDGCTLRDAVTAANAYNGAHHNAGATIAFAPGVTGTITLGSALPNLSSKITLQGPGAKVLTVSGNNAVRVFTISNGTSTGPAVSLFGLTVAHGKDSGSYPANAGGGLANFHGALRLSNCAFAYNMAYFGGGLYNNGYRGSATVSVFNCAFAHNVASFGGGLYNDGYSGGSATANLSNSTFANNSAGAGGGLFNQGYGGHAVARLTNCTVAHNSAPNGGGLLNDGSAAASALLILSNTILYRGTGSGTNLSNFNTGTITSSGYNLSSDDASAFLNHTGDRNRINPQLDPAGLKDNGGPTLTIALLLTSPAVDAGNSSLPTDQRGFRRPVDLPHVTNAAGDNGSDIGAFELQLASTVRLSSGSASVASEGVTLRFMGALDADSASNASHYTVTINGQAVTPESAGYNATTHSVTLGLPAGSLRVGDAVVVKWSSLLDSKSAVLAGQSGTLTAR